MRHISIEGMDGIGKTTLCDLLAKSLGFEFVEKPLHFLLEDAEISDSLVKFSSYRKLARTVNQNPNRDFTALFYGLGSLYLYERFRGTDIVTDRHLASNYAWSGTEKNEDVYDLLVKKIGAPDLTVILYAPEKVIVERLKKRDENDKDIGRAHMVEKITERMAYFCEKYDFPYIRINTEGLNPEEVLKIILKKLSEE